MRLEFLYCAYLLVSRAGFELSTELFWFSELPPHRNSSCYDSNAKDFQPKLIRYTEMKLFSEPGRFTFIVAVHFLLEWLSLTGFWTNCMAKNSFAEWLWGETVCSICRLVDSSIVYQVKLSHLKDLEWAARSRTPFLESCCALQLPIFGVCMHHSYIWWSCESFEAGEEVYFVSLRADTHTHTHTRRCAHQIRVSGGGGGGGQGRCEARGGIRGIDWLPPSALAMQTQHHTLAQLYTHTHIFAGSASFSS